jgi:hypothetical protein
MFAFRMQFLRGSLVYCPPPCKGGYWWVLSSVISHSDPSGQEGVYSLGHVCGLFHFTVGGGCLSWGGYLHDSM